MVLNKPKIVRGRLLLSLVAMYLVLVVVIAYGLEGWLRWKFREKPIPTSERAWVYYPLGAEIAGRTLRCDQLEYSTTMTYNRMGFRDREFPAIKAVGERRILYVGDSFVEGVGVSEEKRFSNLVQTDLVRQGRAFSMINLGQCATDAIQYLNNLANLGIYLQPDIVVFGLYIGNDFQEAAKYPVKSVQARRNSGSQRPTVAPGELGYVRLLIRQAFGRENLLIRRNTSELFLERLYKRPINREMIREYSGLSESDFEQSLAGIDKGLVAASNAGLLNPGSLVDAINRAKHKSEAPWYYSDADFKAVASIIAECRRLCAEKGIAFIVLLIPDISQVTPKSFLETCKRWGFYEMPRRVLQLPELSRRMVKLLHESNIDFIDLTGPLSTLGTRGYYPLDRHLTEAGHRCIANELLQYHVLTALK